MIRKELGMSNEEKRLKVLFQLIDDNVDLLPEILYYVGKRFSEFKEKCKRENNNLMVNALGSACQLLAMPRKPTDMKKHCVLIERAQFPNGLEDWHHEGERKFYNKYLRNDKERTKIK